MEESMEKLDKLIAFAKSDFACKSGSPVLKSVTPGSICTMEQERCILSAIHAHFEAKMQ